MLLGASGENEIHSKHWYNYAGEDAPYREKYHRLEVSGNNIIVRNYDADWEKYPCDMIFERTASSWEGTNYEPCILHDAQMETKMTLTGNQVLCYDAGIKNGEIIWAEKTYISLKSKSRRDFKSTVESTLPFECYATC